MTGSKTIVDALLAAGLINRDQFAGITQQFNNYGGFIEEAILDTNTMDEDALLKALSSIYKLRFVATAKLKKADISQHVLEKVPYDFAVAHNLLPILWDEANLVLSVVVTRPNGPHLEREMCQAAQATKIRSFVARPAAIKAAIAKSYKGDIHAFANIDKESISAFHTMMDVYERNLLDEGSMAAAVAQANTFGREQTLSAADMERGDQRSGRGETATPGLNLELAKVFLALLEGARGELSGHSILTAGFSEKVATRIGLSEHERSALAMASLLHDLGKGDPYHLTPFNVAEWEGHKATAMKRFETPIRLCESANLPVETVAALRHMYEKFDGKGFPDGLAGTEIPLGARILALSDTFADLTSNTRNPYRRTLTTPEAMEVLRKAKGTVFDANMVELFATVVAGDDIKRQLLTGARSVMVVDSDPEQCAIMEMQLISRGFRVRAARSAEEAVKSLMESPVSLILCEVDLKPYDGFELKLRLNNDSRTEKIPLFYFTARASGPDVDRGFALGAADYLVKPSNMDVVATKIQKYLDRAQPAVATGGVSGSLREMSIPDLVQILSHGRKTGQLRLSLGGGHNGEIHFVQGVIYNALYDNLQGAEAFFAMVQYRDGSFSLNPKFQAEAKLIEMNSEMLLLEGLRRFDESNR